MANDQTEMQIDANKVVDQYRLLLSEATHKIVLLEAALAQRTDEARELAQQLAGRAET